MAEFWQNKNLREMSVEEWESLCDRCGRCCLLKLEDIDSGELHFTNIACRHLDSDECRCRHYQSRTALVSECLELTPDSLPQLLDHLPASCAYRRLAQGLALPAWHPLLTGKPLNIGARAISVGGKVVSEDYIHPEQYQEHIIDWFDPYVDSDADNSSGDARLPG